MTVYEWIGIALLLVGFILIGIEMGIPGFGLPGISGILCLIAGIVMTAETVSEGVVLAIIIIILLAVMLAVGMTLLGSSKRKPPIVLKEEVKGKHGFLNSSDLEYLVGKEGVAATDLHPAGKGSFDGIEFDVLSEGKYIVKGSNIRISRVKENKLMVTEVM